MPTIFWLWWAEAKIFHSFSESPIATTWSYFMLFCVMYSSCGYPIDFETTAAFGIAVVKRISSDWSKVGIAATAMAYIHFVTVFVFTPISNYS